MPFAELNHRIEYKWAGPATAEGPGVVLLHHGLGSVSAWRDFPEALGDRLGQRILAYSRFGHGASDVFDQLPQPVDFMHREARELPWLLERFELPVPILLGHSDGASIALIAAGEGRVAPAALVLMAPHVFVEPCTATSARRAHDDFLHGDLAVRMGRHHRDAERTFRGWYETWTAAAFQGWCIEDVLSGIKCPVLVIQGRDDEFGTDEQVTRIRRALPRSPRVVWLEDCGHAPHRDRPETTLACIAEFVGDVVAQVP